MRIALVCLVAYLANGPAECSGKREGDWPKMTRDSKINGLHGGLNASSVSEKDHTQTNVVEARFRKGHARARLLQPLAQYAREEYNGKSKLSGPL